MGLNIEELRTALRQGPRRWKEGDKTDFRQARREYRIDPGFWWGVDEELYRLAKHSVGSPAGYFKKICIIDRTYNAGLERHLRKNVKFDEVAVCLWHNRKKINTIVKTLQGITTLNEKNLRVIVAQHKKFLTIIEGCCRQTNQVRSFASKFLHFHAPIVPVFDGRAKKVCQQQQPYEMYPPEDRFVKQVDIGIERDKCDGEYYDFCRSFFVLYTELKILNLKPTVKEVDAYLLYLYEDI